MQKSTDAPDFVGRVEVIDQSEHRRGEHVQDIVDHLPLFKWAARMSDVRDNHPVLIFSLL